MLITYSFGLCVCMLLEIRVSLCNEQLLIWVCTPKIKLEVVRTNMIMELESIELINLV